MKIWFDLDGVLRNLVREVFGHNEVTHWNYKNCNGKTLVEAVNESPWICYNAEPLPYLGIVNNVMDHIDILTCQRESWKPYTEDWLSDHLKVPYTVQYINNPQNKLLVLGPDDVLVEDYPLYSNYNNICLIDQPYNRDVSAPLRITTPEQLATYLDNWMTVKCLEEM